MLATQIPGKNLSRLFTKANLTRNTGLIEARNSTARQLIIIYLGGGPLRSRTPLFRISVPTVLSGPDEANRLRMRNQRYQVHPTTHKHNQPLLYLATSLLIKFMLKTRFVAKLIYHTYSYTSKRVRCNFLLF